MVAVEAASRVFAPRRVSGVVYVGDRLYDNYVLNGKDFVECDTVHALAATCRLTEYGWWWMDDIYRDWPVVSVDAYRQGSLP